MKILAVGHHYIVDQNRKFWSALLSQHQVEIHIGCPLRWKSNLFNEYVYDQEKPNNDRLLIHPIPVIKSGNGSLYLFHPIKLHRLLNSTRFDWIYIAQEIWSLSALQIILQKKLSKNRRTKVMLFSAQNIKKNKYNFLRPIEKYIAANCSAIGYCCEDAKVVLEWKGIKNDYIFIPYSYDQELFKQVDHHIPNTIETVITIGYMGRLSKEKGIETLLKAITLLEKNHLKVKLKIAGNGPLLDQLKSLPYVEYVGLIPHQSAYTFYKDINVFILPSNTTDTWKEQFGRVLTESVAMNIPVIGSNSGAIPEVLGRMQMPYVFEEGNEQSLAEKIKNIVNDIKSGKITSILENAQKLNYKWHSNAETINRIYQYFRDH